MDNVTELFGSMVFNDTAMRERLPAKTYQRLLSAMLTGSRLDAEMAGVIANAMKAWAIERGATHFTHWFQPMTGVTAEKHDSFLTPVDGGRAIMEFSGKELIQGEPDASSFPSGGLRATFEARGYTAWDPTSYAFIKGRTLCIPTAFCSFGGEALDTKTPLLRSMEAVERQALRILRLFGHLDVKSVKATVGPEQEYFLVDEAMYRKRKDLMYTGRTLFGAMPPKGQELDDHYFGAIKPRVAAFMEELNHELWKLGVPARTEHNEAAPAQHELAPVFSTANIAADHNQLTMETMRRVAASHGLVCLLHEKPFEGVNGSGKHNNWSLSTDTGLNLLEPGDNPYANAQFLLFLVAVIKAVDDYQGALRASVATAGNDHRLGALEAPPAIVSIFLGDELTKILDAVEADEEYTGKEKGLLKLGVHAIPRFARDNTDRNRTSPFAFTGNRFEFRMPGSSVSISRCNTVINTAVAESLRVFADELEHTETDFDTALHAILKREIREHRRIIFNGNGYDEAWVEEAKRRGLLNLSSTPEALPYMLHEKNVAMYRRHRVYSRAELSARCETAIEEYVKLIRIEALTMIDMTAKDFLPAVSRFVRDLAETAAAKHALAKTVQAKSALPAPVDSGYEEKTVRELSDLCARTCAALETLRESVARSHEIDEQTELARYCHDELLPDMAALRETVDAMENLTGSDYWPCPTYGDLLFGVR